MRSDRFAGFEFDWVAADISGKLAIFCTAGYGPIPDKALEACEEQEAVVEAIRAVTGFSDQLDFLTTKGACPLYCFDWEIHGGPYRLKGDPETEEAIGIDSIREELRYSIVHLNLSFCGRKTISADELSEL